MFKKIDEMRGTERGKTVLKLFLYLGFFGIVLVLVAVTGAAKTPYREYESKMSESEVESTSTNEVELTYFEKQKKLLLGKYDFTYKISGSMSLEYNGTYDAGNVEGFKETEDDLIRYSIVDGKVYSVLLGERSEYSELYEGLNAEIFDFEQLFTKLNGTSSSISKSGSEKKYHYLDLEGCDYIVTTNQISITNIEVRSGDLIYNLSYKY